MCSVAAYFIDCVVDEMWIKYLVRFRSREFLFRWSARGADRNPPLAALFLLLDTVR